MPTSDSESRERALGLGWDRVYILALHPWASFVMSQFPSVIVFQVHFIMVREDTLYDLKIFKYIETYFVA